MRLCYDLITQMKVDSFEEILYWPFRLQPCGPLAADRTNPNGSPAQYLSEYSRYICDGGGDWSQLASYFSWSAEVDPVKIQIKQYAERHYFHPFIKDIFFNADPSRSPISILKKNGISRVAIQSYATSPKLIFEVPRIHLYLFPMDLAVLVVHIRYDPCANSHLQQLEHKEILDILDYFRRSFPPFVGINKQAGCSPTYYPGLMPYSVQWLAHSQPALPVDRSSLEPPLQSFDPTSIEFPVANHWRQILSPLVPGPSSARLEAAN